MPMAVEAVQADIAAVCVEAGAAKERSAKRYFNSSYPRRCKHW